jgi:hypothetical protein
LKAIHVAPFQHQLGLEFGLFLPLLLSELAHPVSLFRSLLLLFA